MGLDNEKLVDSRLLLNANFSELPNLLWEVYGEQPTEFLKMLEISKVCGLPRWLRLNGILGWVTAEGIMFNPNTASNDWVNERGSWVDYDPEKWCFHKEFEPIVPGRTAEMFLSQLRTDIHHIVSDRRHADFANFGQSDYATS